MGLANRSQRRVDESSSEFIGGLAVQESYVVLSGGNFLMFPLATWSFPGDGKKTL